MKDIRTTGYKKKPDGNYFIAYCNFQSCRLLLTIMVSLLVCSLVLAQSKSVSQYNIIWTTQSLDATGSMPLSGGNLGLNVSVEVDKLLLLPAWPKEWDVDFKLHAPKKYNHRR